MVVRFYILQNHYRKPTDFNDEQLLDTEKQFKKVSETVNNLRNAIKDVDKYVTDDETVISLKRSLLKQWMTILTQDLQLLIYMR